VPIHELFSNQRALAYVSNSEMSPPEADKVKEIKGLRGGPPRRIAQPIPQIDPPEAEKGPFMDAN